MEKVFRYIAFGFLFINILFSIKGSKIIADNIFYGYMSIASIICIFSVKVIKNIILNRGFILFFYFNLINIVYYILFEFGDIDSFFYLIARFIQFSIFSISVYILKDRFVDVLLIFIKTIALLSLFGSLFFNMPDLSSRYMGIFFNPNEFSIIMVFGFSIILFNDTKNLLNYILLILFLLAIIISGSRSAILGLFISTFIYYYHYRAKNLSNFILIIVSIMLFSFLGGENNAIVRLFSEDWFFNRKYEYLYAIETFLQKPVFGHGLKNYTYLDFSLIKFDDYQIDYGAHNGYISILVQYGLVFSLFFYIIFFRYLRKVFNYDLSIFHSEVLKVRYLFFILIYTLFNGLFENTLVGINFFQSNLFWLTLAYMLFKIYENEGNSVSN